MTTLQLAEKVIVRLRVVEMDGGWVRMHWRPQDSPTYGALRTPGRLLLTMFMTRLGQTQAQGGEISSVVHLGIRERH